MSQSMTATGERSAGSKIILSSLKSEWIRLGGRSAGTRRRSHATSRQKTRDRSDRPEPRRVPPSLRRCGRESPRDGRESPGRSAPGRLRAARQGSRPAAGSASLRRSGVGQSRRQLVADDYSRAVLDDLERRAEHFRIGDRTTRTEAPADRPATALDRMRCSRAMSLAPRGSGPFGGRRKTAGEPSISIK